MGKMKSNQKFRNEEKAVSAVIGVILMVAITVAIAATVYVYVSGMLGGGAEKAPDLAFNKITTGTKGLTLTRADSGLTWDEFSISVNGTAYTALGTSAVTAGDFIPAATAPSYIKIIHTGTNTLMGNWSFY